MKRRVLMTMLGALGLVLIMTGLAMAERSTVVSAEWGVPGNRVDVTARVRTFEQNGVLQFEVTRGVLGVDPAPHRNKELIIRVRRSNGEVEEYNYPERGTVNLQLESHEDHDWRGPGEHRRDPWRDEAAYRNGLRIWRAFYGVEGQFIDVTDALRSRVEGDRLFVRVDNYNLGIDPAPGQRKVLHIVYSINGFRQETTVGEKTYLRLP